jgi:Flp pilus assembly protein CpaB
MSRRYLAVSLATAVLTGFLLHAYLARVAAAAAAGGPMTTEVRAAGPIARGDAIRSGQLRLAEVPGVFAEPGSFTSISQVVGRVALVGLSAGETVTGTRLARVRAGPVASLIPEGLRAFAVPTSLPPGSVAAGDHVDVLATFASGQAHTETVATALEVLFVLGPSGVGTAAGAADASAAGVTQQATLILLVSPEQEERLAFARAFADLAVAVAPP